VTLPVARSGAMQVALLGRASSPLVVAGDAGGDEGSFAPPCPPPHPANSKVQDNAMPAVRPTRSIRAPFFTVYATSVRYARRVVFVPSRHVQSRQVAAAA
jgi:hypothetical protein